MRMMMKNTNGNYRGYGVVTLHPLGSHFTHWVHTQWVKCNDTVTPIKTQ